jgi:hypothetical protein
MRRLGLMFWLLRVALPAILAHWAGRIGHALRLGAGSPDDRQQHEDSVAALLAALRWSTIISTLLLLLIIVEVLRLVSRW